MKNKHSPIYTWIFLLLAGVAIAGVLILIDKNEYEAPSYPSISFNRSGVEDESSSTKNTTSTQKEENTTTISPNEDQFVLYDVPFTSQAPLGEWDDPRQQDGCEEAASLMAVRWARGQSLTLQEARKEIIAISEYEKDEYGEFHDSSAADTQERILEGYFNADNTTLKRGVTVEDIKRELYKGNIVIAPFDGTKLNNPYFTPPGPERHMAVIRGYDPATDEFIVNDNGTSRGEAFRYTSANISASLRDYVTGYKEPITTKTTAMIVVSN